MASCKGGTFFETRCNYRPLSRLNFIDERSKTTTDIVIKINTNKATVKQIQQQKQLCIAQKSTEIKFC